MKRRLRRTAAALATGIAVAVLAGCGAPRYTYAVDAADHAYFKVPASWQQVSPARLIQAQIASLGGSLAGPQGGSFTWARAYASDTGPIVGTLIAGSEIPVVYASVQTLKSNLRGALSLDLMRDLILPVTPQARQQAASRGADATSFALDSSSTISLPGGIHGINELFEYSLNGVPAAFDQTVLTNTDTTKLYLLLVQCFKNCFAAHFAQIKAVVNSYTVRGS